MYSYLDLLVLSSILGIWTAIISLLYNTFARKNVLLEQLKEENNELRKQMKNECDRLKQYYEQLLKDAAVKNTIMSALYNAWKNGSLSECYKSDGMPTILADGTMLCRKGKDEESYVIRVTDDAATI